ncbi:hypothetical protein C8R43DRAFT_888943 [Mycena crocata]|nr:hypothetical protein C8R43DRAFT_888943 [Mycena crocata]
MFDKTVLTLVRLLPIGAGAVVEILTSSEQTGVLMPHGASSWDARSQQVLYDYACTHDQSWYAFVNGPLQHMIRKDGLYLISGITKSTSWCIASSDDSSGGGKLSLLLKAAHFGGVNATRTWEWETSTASVHSGPQHRPGEEEWRDNQTLFIRGFKVSLSTLSTKPKVVSIVKCKIEDIFTGTTSPV